MNFGNKNENKLSIYDTYNRFNLCGLLPFYYVLYYICNILTQVSYSITSICST